MHERPQKGELRSGGGLSCRDMARGEVGVSHADVFDWGSKK
jgi:hypothetical protein